MVTPTMGAAMMDPMYSLRENGTQRGFRGFHLRISTLQGSRGTEMDFPALKLSKTNGSFSKTKIVNYAQWVFNCEKSHSSPFRFSIPTPCFDSSGMSQVRKVGKKSVKAR